MRGYVAQKGDRWYAVIYEGLDPVTGKERRSGHPAGTNRDDAERLAADLAARVNGQRPGSVAHLRGLSDDPMAAGQETGVGAQHLGRVPAEGRPPCTPPHPGGSRFVGSAPITWTNCMT